MNVAHVRAVIRYGSAELLAAVIQDASRKTGHSAKELSAAFQLIDGVAPVVVVSHRAGVDLAALDPATSFKMIGAAPGYSSALLLWPASADPENGEARYFLYKCGPDTTRRCRSTANSTKSAGTTPCEPIIQCGSRRNCRKTFFHQLTRRLLSCDDTAAEATAPLRPPDQGGTRPKVAPLQSDVRLVRQ